LRNALAKAWCDPRSWRGADGAGSIAAMAAGRPAAVRPDLIRSDLQLVAAACSTWR
jgi:hypothetical protein